MVVCVLHMKNKLLKQNSLHFRVNILFILTVHRQIRRGTLIMILCRLKHPSQRALCFRSSVDRRLHPKRRFTLFTLFTVSTVTDNYDNNCSLLCAVSYLSGVCAFRTGLLTCIISTGERPRKLYNERALNLPLGAELITGNIWYSILFYFSFTITSINITSKLCNVTISPLVISSPHPLTLSARTG